MFFKRIKTPGIAHNAYLLGSKGIGIIIDPRRDIDEYLQIARENKLQIKFILETHRQEDFVFGSNQIREVTQAEIVSGKHKYSAHSDIYLEDGDEFKVGDLIIRCLYTPGHTPESVSYACYLSDKSKSAWAVFTGDALFIGGAGRTDLPDPVKTAENAAILYDSIQQKILPLGDQTLLYPAHGSGSVCGGNIAEYDESTLGFERTYNPAFVCSKIEFVKNKIKERIPRPPYFELMEALNLRGGIKLSQSPDAIPVLTPQDFARESENGIIFDTRLPEAFAGGHIAKSYSIWLEGLPAFGGWFADDEIPIYLVLERPDDLKKAFLSLQRIGVDNICGVLAGGFEAWRDAGLKIQMSGTLSVMSDSLEIDQPRVLDVREITEYEAGHIEKSKHAYVGHLPSLTNLKNELDPLEQLVVTCGVGHRASVAISILLRSGYKDVYNLLGGITAWKKLDLPLVKGADTYLAPLADEAQPRMIQ